MTQEKVSAGDENRAIRIVYGLRTDPAVREVASIRTVAGCRLAYGMERRMTGRSAVLAALGRREASLVQAKARKGGAIDPLLAILFFAVIVAAWTLVAMRLVLVAPLRDGSDVWPDEVCEQCGRAGVEMDAGCFGEIGDE